MCMGFCVCMHNGRCGLVYAGCVHHLYVCVGPGMVSLCVGILV